MWGKWEKVEKLKWNEKKTLKARWKKCNDFNQEKWWQRTKVDAKQESAKNSIFQPTTKRKTLKKWKFNPLMTPNTITATNHLPSSIFSHFKIRKYSRKCKIYGWSKKIHSFSKNGKILLTPGNWLAIKRCINDVFPTRTSPTKTIFIECWCW